MLRDVDERLTHAARFRTIHANGEMAAIGPCVSMKCVLRFGERVAWRTNDGSFEEFRSRYTNEFIAKSA
jgi:hypothetical protein